MTEPASMRDPAAEAVQAVAPFLESDPAQVLQACTKALGSNPFLGQAYALLGKVFQNAGDRASADRLSFLARGAGLVLVSRGDLHESADLFSAVSGVFPDPCRPYELLYRQISDLTRLYRSAVVAPGPRRRSVIAISAWGPRYVDLLTEYLVPSLLSPNNVPALSEIREVHVDIYTTAQFVDAIRDTPSFQRLGRYAQIHFTLFSEEILASAEYSRPAAYFRFRLFGGLHHLAIERARSLGADISLITPDCIYSDGAFLNFARFIDDGYQCVLATAIRAQAEVVLPLLDELRDPQSHALSVPPRRLVEINLQNVHYSYRGFILTKGNRSTPAGPPVLAFPHAHGIHIRCLHIQPMYLSADVIRKDVKLDYQPIDANVLAHLFPTPEDCQRVKIIQDSDDGFCLDLTYAHAAGTADPQEARAEFSRELLLQHASGFLPQHFWVFEHRINFHGDAEIDAIGTFDHMPDGSLKRVSLPVSSRIDLDDEELATWFKANQPHTRAGATGRAGSEAPPSPPVRSGC